MLSIAQGSNRGLAEGWSQGDLPGLNLTHNQLFFLSFAQVPSCSTWFWKFILITLFDALGVVWASNSGGGSSFGDYVSFLQLIAYFYDFANAIAYFYDFQMKMH